MTEKKSKVESKKNLINGYQFKTRIKEQGVITAVGDGIIWVKGLPSAALDEVLLIEDGSQALVFHLTEDLVGAILLNETSSLCSNAAVQGTGLPLSIPIGGELFGRVIDPMGHPLDGKPAPKYTDQRRIDVLSPPIIDRDFVNKPLYTGNKILDTMIPIGKGQRQLLIGDNGLGKSSLSMDIIINQKNKNVHCIYVLIGQKRSSVVNTIETLEKFGAMEHTTCVVAEATALPGLKYIAPYSACTIAEAMMHKGEDTLIIYDDLITHAESYRELSLLLRRPPGREAFPADIFYLHSRLLERSTCLSKEKGGGSMTAFPVVETREGEITAYIPTNLISITDGQVYFEEKLFGSGVLPAIDITRSVSRIGGKAQDPIIKKEAGRMKFDYLQFLELEAFTKFGAKLDPSTELKIKRGKVLREILKQDRLSPFSIEYQISWLIAFNDGLLDEIEPEAIPTLLTVLHKAGSKSDLTVNSPRSSWEQLIADGLKEFRDK